MLITCPECELPVSDRAISCPHCGYPMKGSNQPVPRQKRKSKHRRLPNGFGQISEIKGRNLRKPFRAMISVGKHENGRPICKPLKPQSYFETYNEAYTALIEYNRNPYDLQNEMSCDELFAKWSSEHYKNSERGLQNVQSLWKYCGTVYSVPVRSLRPHHIKTCMYDGVAVFKGEEHHTTEKMAVRIKSLFNNMLDYAVEFELVDKNYARAFSTANDVQSEAEKTENPHMAFIDEELDTLWNNLGIIPDVDLILIQCYSGWRPQELGLIELKNVYLKEGIMIGGMKTDAGTDRIVPIHSKIRPLVEARYLEATELNSDKLFNAVGSTYRKSDLMLTYYRYRTRFINIMNTLNLNPKHSPHDGRKTFVTKAKEANMNEYAIKYIVGHTITDITERTYTERKPEWLKAEIEKIR